MDRSRRRILRAGFALGTVSTAGCLGDGDAANDDPGNETSAPDDETQSAETSHVDVGSEAAVWRYSDGNAAVAHGSGLLVGHPDPATDTCLIALDADTGDLSWEFYADASWSGCPDPIVEGAVFLSYTNDASRGGVVALEPDGTKRWEKSVNSAMNPFQVGDDTVFVASFDGPIYALDSADGSELWSRQPEGEAGWRVYALSDDVVVAASDGRLLALDPESGDELWDHTADETVLDAHCAGGVVYATGSEVGYLTDGSVQWTVDVDSTPDLTESVDDSIVVATADEVLAVDLGSGDVRWREAVDVAPTVVVEDSSVHIGATNLRTVQSDGTTVRSVNLDDSTVGAVTTGDESVYASTDEGVYRIEDADDVRFTTAVSGAEQLIAAEHTYVGRDGETVALDLS